MAEPVRPLDIHFASGEIVTIDLDNLNTEPGSTIVEMLREGQCHVKAWVRLATEYWRLGLVDVAVDIANNAVQWFMSNGDEASLPRVHALLGNLLLERARTAPKMIISDARGDVMANASPKSHYHQQTAQHMNHAAELAAREVSKDDVRTQSLIYLTRGNYLLSIRQLDDALNAFEQVLALRPSNIPSLLGKARIFYTRRQHREALKIFQRVLALNPMVAPDPRIGIGLCLWALNNHDKARAAWQRSLELDAASWPALLLLGLDALNSSKQATRSSEERAELYKTGLTRIQTVFKLNKYNAAAANALSEFFLRKNDINTALRLAERTMQFADTLPLFTDGHLRTARVAHASGRFDDARRHYASAVEGAPKHLLANLGVAQMQIQNDEILAAIHTLDSIVKQHSLDIASLEALPVLASLRAYPRPAITNQEVLAEKSRAKELFDRLSKIMETISAALNDPARLQPFLANRTLDSVLHVFRDVELHVEIANLWSKDSLERASKSLMEAVQFIKSTDSSISAIPISYLVNNLAVIRHLEGSFEEARTLYEEALPSAIATGTSESDNASATMLYNLARVYEDVDDPSAAQDAYYKLLGRHPEYVDAKCRLAIMRMDEKRYDEAHTFIKQALTSDPKNSEVRAFYIHLLCATGQSKTAKGFTFNVLKDDGRDVYALCAAGRLSYQEARESRDPSPQAVAVRKDNFQKAANIFIKALSIDPSCAIAAQGLAIIIAEDSLEAWTPGQLTEDIQFRNRTLRNTRQALDILAKVRESLNDGSVHINMGHCHFVREEYEKAIENYETASQRYYQGQNVSVLMYLARTWFAKANKSSSFAAMRQALKFAQTAYHAQPYDKAVLYNIAMIEQKAGELMFALPPDKRTLADLQSGIAHAVHAQKLFLSLASDTARPLPYSQDIAQQRHKYGDTMLRRSAEHLTAQKAHETEYQARLDQARKSRQELKERQDAEQAKKLLEIQEHAKALAERRAAQRKEVEEWAVRQKQESEEEDERKADKARKAAARKAKQEANFSGDEGGESRGKKRRKIKQRKRWGRKSPILFFRTRRMLESKLMGLANPKR
ncbi:uncharacterized protein EI90DRAFT_3144919 [Cantharellus anzutake]|uniref:uncharacterized protein n=1 Tax=Cantharellus anzutake TaxID=1750568 RepID=UPI00190572A0|nr:uncharacterized protein EI90DRAFT_3144919 [Cantharellus anzutake]KAF8334987.1 hypothetical protein EI90DRAFT_3144919 [Cantharellus anzutake]